MKVIVCHNFYQQPGGEDQVFADETALLERNGHTVIRFTMHNDSVKLTGRLKLMCKTFWNARTHEDIGKLVRETGTHVVHFHNTFPLISPAAYYAARGAGAAVVQTLHNYRLLCPNGTLFRDGKVCEQCIDKNFAWPGAVHGCYRGDRQATAVAATMLAAHRAVGTFANVVDSYIALTQFARNKFVKNGLPSARVVVKPNFVSDDPGPGNGGDYALFVGRLEHGKGVDTMLRAWAVPGKLPPLRIVGDGPMAPQVRQAVSESPNIQWLGRRPLKEVYELMGGAMCLLIPSLWYEGLPKTLVEAFARGTPVVASRLGSMVELFEHGRNGLHFTADDASELTSTVTYLATHPEHLAQMRVAARAEFERRYTAEQNYDAMMAIYRSALSRRKKLDHELAQLDPEPIEPLVAELQR